MSWLLSEIELASVIGFATFAIVSGTGDETMLVGAVGDDWLSTSEVSDVDLVISGALGAAAASAIHLALIASLWEHSSASAIFAGSMILLDACSVHFGQVANGADGVAFDIEVTLQLS
jgi:hypothetical protein